MPETSDDERWRSVLESATEALRRGETDLAIDRYSDYIRLNDARAEAYYKRAIAYTLSSRLDAALADYDRATGLNPNYGYAYCNRGSVLERMGRAEDALRSYDRAIALDAADHLAQYNRGTVLQKLGRLEEALTCFHRAIALRPEQAEAYVNQGNVLQEMGLHQQAIASFDAAVERRPDLVEAWQGRATSEHQLKQYDEAITSFGRALALNPAQKFIAGARRYAQMLACHWDGFETDLQRIALAVERGEPVSPPFPLLALLDEPGLHRKAAEIWMRSECKANHSMPTLPRRVRGSRIRVGYFSADFRDHPVSQLTAELFERHDRKRFELTAFAFGPPGHDRMRTRLENAFDQFIDVRVQSDYDIALLARKLEIDVAVDLGGLTEHSRSGIFALRTAPVQVAYLGYPGTSGAECFDYIIADRNVIPQSQQRFYSEKIIYLPRCYLPSDSVAPSNMSAMSRSQFELADDAFVFCCFNNPYKITPRMFDSWMGILRQAPGSLLWLSRGSAAAADNLQREARRRGVSPERLVFAGRMALLADHRARLGFADLFLDTFPYNAHATALDALRAGLPILTRCGKSFAARVAMSLLAEIGRSELVTDTQDDYDRTAIELFRSPNRLKELRRELRLSVSTAALFDVQQFVRSLESAYEIALERHSRCLAPEHIDVAS